MKEAKKKVLGLNKDDYYEMHLSIVNCLLNIKMTSKEISVLAAFMALNGDIAKARFGPTAKKIVRDKLILSHGGLSNHLRNLLDKGFLEESVDTLSIPTILYPDIDEQEYLIKLKNIDVNGS